MAGGEGTRLRPISANKPKPMVDLIDRPVLEHIIALLKRNGVTESCLTLKYLPQMITEHFGSGDRFGMRLEYRTETQALGTAGGVLNCADFLGSEDFIVISGDCVCDFDLKSLMDFHRARKAEVTLALYSHAEPCEFGLVVTREDGRVERFLEKPAWDHVITDQINTGIYILSPAILSEIPKGEAYDFGRDLFPKLLREGRAVFGFKAEGYWCDIGSVGAYIKCCHDIIRGDVKAELRAPLVKDGIYSASPLPEGVVLKPPVYIGEKAVIDKGAEIGPYAVIGASSVIGGDSVIRHSVINGAVINENAALNGAVVCKNASVGRGTTLEEGSVVGENCLIGDHCVIASSVRLWPDRQIPSGSFISDSVSHGMLRAELSFTKPGVISGALGTAVTADACLRLGEAARDFSRVGIGWNGGEGARVMAEAFGCGVCAAGGELIRHDGDFLACASYAGQVFDLPMTVFFEENRDEISISFFGKNGGKITHDTERKLEAALLEPHKALPRRTGRASTVMGLTDAYVCAAARRARFDYDNSQSLNVAVTGKGPENRALKNALLMLGCSVADKRNGLPVLEVTNGGYSLTVTDEEGYRLSDDQLKVAAAFVELSHGVKALAVQYDAPDAIDSLAGGFNAEILRVGRDGQRAEILLSEQMVMQNGVFMGARLCAWLKSRGEKLCDLRKKIPKFSSMAKEIMLKGSRGAVMRLMASSCSGMASETTSGLRLETDRGYVYISPLRERSALKIRTESYNEETAEELCAEFERRTREMDKA